MAVAVALFLAGAPAAYPQSSAGPCELGPGFAALREALGAETVGGCAQQAMSTASGDTQQRTTTGLLFWRKVDNVPGFTDGATTWLLGPSGLEMRAAPDLLPWEPTPTPTPRPTPTRVVADVDVVAQGYGVASGTGLAVTYAAVLQNRRTDRAAANVAYQVTGYDVGGAVLLADAGTVSRIEPGGQAAIANTLSLDTFLTPGRPIARLEVLLSSASFPTPDPGASLAFANVVYGPSSVQGTVTNVTNRDIGYARLVAVVYGPDGSIAGGGSSYSGPLPAGSASPVSLPVFVWGTPARAEISAEPVPAI